MSSTTKGNPVRLILILALPIFLSYLLQQFYAIVDLMIIGHYVGEDALAALGNVSPYDFMILMFAQGCATGFSVLVAQRFGAKDLAGSRKSFATGIILALIISLVVTGISIGFLKTLLKIINTPENIFEGSFIYASIILAGTIFNFFYNYVFAVLRAVGDTKTPLFFLLGATILNIILDLIVVILFHWGVAGAAAATVFSQATTAVSCLAYTLVRYKDLRLSKADFKAVDRREVGRHLKLGLPMAFQYSVKSIGIIVMQSAINGYGSVATAAVAAANKGENIFLTPLNALGTAMVTYVGQNYGAKQYKRIKEGVYKMMLIQFPLALVLGAIVVGLSSYIAPIFVAEADPEFVYYSRIYLICLGTFFPFMAGIFFYRNILQGIGKTIVPFASGVLELLARALGALYLPKAFPVENSFWGVGLSTPIAWFLGTLTMLIVTHVIISSTKYRSNLPLPEEEAEESK